MWEAKTAIDDSVWTEEYARLVIGTYARRPIPRSLQRIGSTEVAWHQPILGWYHVHATGGTVDDRLLARAIVAGQLDAYGLRPLSFTLGGPTLRKTADWNEVQEKAIRLMNDGSVQILRNAPDVVVGHVIGDHGEYQTEISRQDPNSNVIDHWTCECWLPGTLVVMANGTRKPIEIVQAGELVLTASGHVGTVRCAMSRDYEGVLYGMKMQGSTETWWATDTHKLFTPNYDPIEAQAVQAGDYTFMPVPQVDRPRSGFDTQYLFPERIEQDDGWLYKPNKLFGSKRVIKSKRPTTPINLRVRPISKTWVWTKELMRFLGLYTAEGLVTAKGEIRLFFGPREHGLVDETCEMLRILGCDPFVKFGRHCWVVSAQHAAVGKVLGTLIGTGSKTKTLHESIMQAPAVMLQEFLDGWVDGDGYESKDGRTTLATASDDLAMQARFILARLGISSVMRVVADNSSPLVPGGLHINHIVWRTDGVDARKIRYATATGINQRMTQPEQRPYSGLVYNIEVDADIGGHSYVIGDGIASANCPWDQFAWQRTRQWKNMEGRPCAHVLATQWYAQGMPLDQEFDPATGQPTAAPGGQIGLPLGVPAIRPPGGMAPPGMPGASPPAPSQQLSIPGIAPGTMDATPPVPPGPNILPSAPMPPAPPPVSVPGAKVPDAMNPMQWPGGTFSKIATKPQLGDPYDYGVGGYGKGMEYEDGQVREWHTENWVTEGGAPHHDDMNDAAPHAYPVRYWIIHPDGREEQTWPPEGEDEDDDWHFGAAGDTFENSDMVRINKEEYGVAEGKSEEHGAGQWRTIKKNSIGEVLGQDSTTGWCDVIFPIHDSGPMEPYHVRAWIEPAMLTHMPGVKKPGPFIRRKR